MQQISLPDLDIVDVPSCTPSPRQSVTKANALINSITPLELTEQRILAAVLSKVNPQADLKQGCTLRMKLQVGEIATLCQMHPTNIRRYFVSKASEMIKISIELPRPRDQAGKAESKTRGTLIPLFYKIDYDTSNLSLECTIHPELMPYIHNLSGHFTSYRLSHFTSLTSKYHTRLYEVLSVGATWGRMTLLLWDPAEPDRSLYALLGLVDSNGKHLHSKYSNYTNFRQRVLDPGLAEINEKTDLNVSLVDTTRRGRPIYSLTFSIGRQRKQVGLVPRLRALGITEGIAVRFYRDHPANVLEACCQVMESAIDNGVAIENAKNYLKHLIKLGVHLLPDSLNPFDPRYKGNLCAQKFLSDYLVPAYHKVVPAARPGLEDLALEHPAVAPEYRIFSELFKQKTTRDYCQSVDDLVEDIDNMRYLQH